MTLKVKELLKFTKQEFALKACPEKAIEMAAYMKTKTPFYGIQKPDRLPIYKHIRKNFAPNNQDQYKQAVIALWNLPHREEKYLALDYACHFNDFITVESLPLYEQLVREGAWWDFVDVLAIHLVGKVYLKDRKIKTVMNKWINDQDMWIRRSAILSQNAHKSQTDANVLFDFCLKRADEKEFFIRKAIGWALREYSYISPKEVKQFLLKNQNLLSPLSFREGAKGLMREGLMS